MYAKYDFRKKPSSKEDEDEQPLYPPHRIERNHRLSTNCKEIAQASSFTPADIEGVQLAIENKNIRIFSQRTPPVQLGNLGYFPASELAAPDNGCQKRYMHSPFISIMENFRPSSSFERRFAGLCRKSEVGFAHSAEVPVEGNPSPQAEVSG